MTLRRHVYQLVLWTTVNQTLNSFGRSTISADQNLDLSYKNYKRLPMKPLHSITHTMGCYSDIESMLAAHIFFYSLRTTTKPTYKDYKNTLRVKSYHRQDPKSTSEWFWGSPASIDCKPSPPLTHVWVTNATVDSCKVTIWLKFPESSSNMIVLQLPLFQIDKFYTILATAYIICMYGSLDACNDCI